MMKKRVRFFVVAVALTTTILLRAPVGVQAGPTGDPLEYLAGQKPDACLTIIQSALQRVYDSCTTLTRNSACYGHNDIEAQLVTPLQFSQPGDRVPLRAVKTILTSRLDPEKDSWGVSLLKLQANLPDTLPGQNVMFLVYGDTSLENAGENMQAFYFTTGFGDLSCQEVAPDAILVRSPEHMQVTFTANGVNVTIASTVVLRAMRNKAMQVQLLEGQALVSTSKGSQALRAGQMVYIGLGGKNGLEAVTAPSAPISALPDSRLIPLLALLDRFGGRPTRLVYVPVPDNSGEPTDDPGGRSGVRVNQSSGSTGGGNQAPSTGAPQPTSVLPTATLSGLPGTPTKGPKPTYTPKPTKVPPSPTP